jgi:hypothetical protein
VRAEENEHPELEQALVSTLYTSTRSLAAGAVAGTIVGLTVAAVTSDPVVAAIGIAIPLVGALRVAHALYFLKAGARSRMKSAEHVYEGGAWIFSLLVGLLAFFTLSRTEHSGLHLLVSCMAVGYAAGICARNAARPHIARGQLALSVLPASVALAMGDDPVRWVLAGVNLVFVAGLSEITSNTHKIFLSALEGATSERKKASGHSAACRSWHGRPTARGRPFTSRSNGPSSWGPKKSGAATRRLAWCTRPTGPRWTKSGAMR